MVSGQESGVRDQDSVAAASLPPSGSLHELRAREGPSPAAPLGLRPQADRVFQIEVALVPVADRRPAVHHRQRGVVADITASAVTFLLSFLLIRQGYGLLSLIVAVVIANALAVLIAWLLAVRLVKLKPSFRWRFIRSFQV